MTDCPNCEYHRQRAQRWREETYKLSGHPLPVQEPVSNPLDCGVYLGIGKDHAIKHCIDAPSPKCEWVGLTDDAEIFAISNTMPYANRFEFARAIEAKLKERNKC